VFFIWPASQALYQSVLQEDAFGTSSAFVWFDNFIDLFSSAEYLHSFHVTLVFSAAVAALALVTALLLAVMADRAVRSATAYKTLIIWPYAVAPVVAGVLWYFLFNPTVGMMAFFLRGIGIDWNHTLNGGQAMALVIIAAAWREVSYNFLFFLAGLQAIPQPFIEAAAIDGAGPWRRFWTIVFPLLSPTAFFLIVVNLVYAFFDTFGVIHALTRGGPSYATDILVYKVFNDGFINLDLGGSAAQSVILMLVVITLTVVQFRFIERKVHY
jgi:sn-glycerol 3-phosphate transport system permease protein